LISRGGGSKTELKSAIRYTFSNRLKEERRRDEKKKEKEKKNQNNNKRRKKYEKSNESS